MNSRPLQSLSHSVLVIIEQREFQNTNKNLGLTAKNKKSHFALLGKVAYSITYPVEWIGHT